MQAPRIRRTGRDDGFTILEVTIAFALVLGVMASAGAFFVKSMQTSLLQEQRQGAGVLLDQTIEQARALTPTALIEGRTATTRATQLAEGTTGATLGPAGLLPILTTVLGMPIATATPPLPLSTTRTVGSTTYKVRSFVDGCVRALTASAVCTANPVTSVSTLLALNGSATLQPTARLMLRVTVSVSWKGRSTSCSLDGNRCEVLGTTLIDIGSDPTFPTGP